MSDQTVLNSPLPTDSIELRAILAVLRRQFRVMVYSAAICFGLACLFLVLVSPRYTATALLLVEPTGRDVLRPAEMSVPNGSSESARIESEAEILRSTSVALAVVKDLGLQGIQEFQPGANPVGRLFGALGIGRRIDPIAASDNQALRSYQDAVSVKRRGLTYLISVDAHSSDPELAALLANRTAEIYISQHLDGKIAAALAGRDILSDQITAAMDRLESTEDSLDEFIAAETNAYASDTGDFHAVLAEFKALRDLTADRNAVAQMASNLIANDDWISVADVLKDDRMRSLAEAKQHPQSAQLSLDDIDTALRKRAAQQMDTLAKEVARLEQKTSGLRLAVRQSLPTDGLTSAQLAALYAIGKEADIARDQYQLLLSRMRDLETEAGLQLANARIVSSAVTPDEPTFPNRNIVLLLALAASVGLGVSSAFLSEYFIGGITSETQLAEVTGLRSAGGIPFVEEENGGRLSAADRVVDQPLSPYAESFRKLRATIDFELVPPREAEGQGKVIAVTSSHPGEGKTTSALALARTYAIAGRKTLLIDCDLRKPSIHRHIGVAPTSGLESYLRNQEENGGIRDFYARDPATPLALILGATPSEQTTDQLLVSDGFARIMEQARAVYEVVVLDTTPVLPVVDARYVIPLADVVVMAVKWASTAQGDLRSALHPIHQSVFAGAPILPVLTQCQSQPGFLSYENYSY